MKKLLPVLSSLLLALGATASEFDPAHVPTEARWVAHLDLDALRKTQVGAMVLGHLNEGTANNQLNAVKAMIGIDPRTDLRGFTVFGASERPEEAAVVAHGTFDAERLLTLLRANGSYAAEDAGDGLTLHRWKDDKKGTLQYGMFIRDRIVISQGREAMKVVAGTLLGQRNSLATTPSAALRTDGFKGAVFAASANLEGIAAKDPKAAMLKNALSASVSLGEAGDSIVGRLSVLAADDATAGQLNAMASGMVAFALMNQDADPNVKKLAQGLSSAQNGKTVQVELKLPVGEIKEKLDQEIRRNQARRNA